MQPPSKSSSRVCSLIGLVLVVYGVVAVTPSWDDADAPVIEKDAIGVVTSVRPPTPIPGPPFTPAHSHLRFAADAFGTDSGTLRETDAREDGTVHFEQIVKGVPVLGGEVVLILDRTGSLVSARGRVSSRFEGSFPSAGTTDGTGVRNALGSVAHHAHVPASTLDAGTAVPAWFDQRLFGVQGDGTARPAYLVDVRETVHDRRWRVVVDAHSGSVLTFWLTAPR